MAGQVSYKIGDLDIKLDKSIVEKNCAGGKSISEETFTRFAALCKQNKLNPFTREAYILVVGESGRVNIMIGKDGYFKMADSNPNYDGIEDGIVVEDKNGNIQYLNGCFTPPGCKLLAGWAKAYSKDKKYPKYSVVSMEEYMGSAKSLWATKPATMINKVAKCQALRDLFPQTFNGTYDESEINNQEEPENLSKNVVAQDTNKPVVAKTTVEVAKTEVKAPVKKEQASIVMSLDNALQVKTLGRNNKEVTLESMLNACNTQELVEKAKKFLMDNCQSDKPYSELKEASLVILQAINKNEYKFNI